MPNMPMGTKNGEIFKRSCHLLYTYFGIITLSSIVSLATMVYLRSPESSIGVISVFVVADMLMQW